MVTTKSFVHIGYPRTGSTFLQKSFFHLLPNINYINYTEVENVSKIYFKDVIKDDFPCFKNPQQDLLFSDEKLCGQLFYHANNQDLILNNIETLFDKPHIIVTLRYQVDLLSSYYRHYIEYGGYHHFEQLVRNNKFYLISNCIDFTLFHYEVLIEKLYKRFGKENVSVFFYEEIFSNFDKFASEFAALVGSKYEINSVNHTKAEHKSLKIACLLQLRKWNHLFRSRYNLGGLLKVSRTKIKKTNSLFGNSGNMEDLIPALKKLDAEFIESNIALQKLLGRDLPAKFKTKQS